MSEARCELIISPTARRQLAEKLPEAAAFAAYELIVGPFLDNPQRTGKRLMPPLNDRDSARRGTYRVIYRINEEQRAVTVVAVVHRSDAYRIGRRPPSSRHKFSGIRSQSLSSGTDEENPEADIGMAVVGWIAQQKQDTRCFGGVIGATLRNTSSVDASHSRASFR